MKNFLKDNLKAKVICILFAFVMWIYVMSEENPVINSDYRDVPVTISNMQDVKAEELVLAPGTKLRTKVTLKGRRSAVSEAERIGFKAYGILTEPKEGSNALKLYLDLENPNVEYFLTPASINLLLEKNVLVQKPVAVNQKGSLDKNLEIDSIKTNPTNVYVEGPKSIVDKIVSVRTTLDISGNGKDFSKKLTIVPVDKEGNQVNGIKLSEDSVFVHATVVESKKVPITLKLVGTEEGDLRLSGYSLDPAEVSIKGPSSVMGSITEIATENLDVNKLLQSSNVSIKLIIPDNIKSEVSTVKIKTTTEKLMTKEFDISKDRIQIKGNGQLPNISDNINIPETIKVKVIFVSGTDDEISENDINLSIEMNDYNSNPAKVPLRVELNKKHESVEITPLEIDFQGQ